MLKNGLSHTVDIRGPRSNRGKSMRSHRRAGVQTRPMSRRCRHDTLHCVAARMWRCARADALNRSLYPDSRVSRLTLRQRATRGERMRIKRGERSRTKGKPRARTELARNDKRRNVDMSKCRKWKDTSEWFFYLHGKLSLKRAN